MDKTYTETFALVQERYKETGKLLCERFYNSAGQGDRGGLPSFIAYDEETGKAVVISYYKNGKEHREGGPASISIDPQTGIITREAWSLEGKLHREGGEPAYISRDKNTGEINSRSYFFHDREYKKEVVGIEANRLVP